MLQNFQEKFKAIPVTSGGGGALGVPMPAICQFKAIEGEIQRLDIWLSLPISGEATFNVLLNGVPLFSGINRPQIIAGGTHVAKTGLSIAVALGDTITLDLVSITGLIRIVYFDVLIDDGISVPMSGSLNDLDDVDTSGVSAGDVLTFDDGDNTWKPAAPTGGGSGIVESVVAGSNVSIDSSDPANPIISSSGGPPGTPGINGVGVPAGGADGYILKKASGVNYDTVWEPEVLVSRIQTVTSSATVTPDADANDEVVITAQAAALTIAAPTGSPTQGQSLLIRIKDNGTARGITWNSIFRAIGVTLPTTTVISKTQYVGCVYNSTDSKWDVLGVPLEA
jgi:hypothetical protein